LKRVVPIQQRQRHEIPSILQDDALGFMLERYLTAIEVGNREGILRRVAKRGDRD
jgi:hypothetical protein